jgi:hypothetical protein
MTTRVGRSGCIGIGSVMQDLVLMAENTVDARQLGVACAGVVFFHSPGGTIGVTALGSLVAWRVRASVLDHADQLKKAGVDPAHRDPARISDSGALTEPLLALVTVIAIALLPPKPSSTRTRAERPPAPELEASATRPAECPARGRCVRLSDPRRLRAPGSSTSGPAMLATLRTTLVVATRVRSTAVKGLRRAGDSNVGIARSWTSWSN